MKEIPVYLKSYNVYSPNEQERHDLAKQDIKVGIKTYFNGFQHKSPTVSHKIHTKGVGITLDPSWPISKKIDDNLKLSPKDQEAL